MSLYVLHADSIATLAVDDPVIAARDVAPLRDAVAALARAEEIGRGIAARVDAEVTAARDAGYAEGHRAGIAAAETEARDRLFALTMRATEARVQARADVSRLALEVVRRIAGELGEAATVAALADRAAADLLPDAVAVVRVPPAALGSTVERLAGRPGLMVVADPALVANDCLVETDLGVARAGLDTQLAAVERAWATAEAGDAA